MSLQSHSKVVAIVQSNYIPWKGYFDLIGLADEFILLDDVQYTVRDWRNRNRIKTPNGLQWLTIPVAVKGRRFQSIQDTTISDPVWKQKAERVARLAKDITEVMADIGLANVSPKRLTVAYHSACSMQHGQKLIEPPKKLLRDAGFTVKDVPEGHLCCGWAGTYQVLQPELSRRLRDRKVANIESLRPDVIAAGNFGCIGNIAAATKIPMAHTVELLDWATGGPKPAALGSS